MRNLMVGESTSSSFYWIFIVLNVYEAASHKEISQQSTWSVSDHGFRKDFSREGPIVDFSRGSQTFFSRGGGEKW